MGKWLPNGIDDDFDDFDKLDFDEVDDMDSLNEFDDIDEIEHQSHYRNRNDRRKFRFDERDIASGRKRVRQKPYESRHEEF